MVIRDRLEAEGAKMGAGGKTGGRTAKERNTAAAITVEGTVAEAVEAAVSTTATTAIRGTAAEVAEAAGTLVNLFNHCKPTEEVNILVVVPLEDLGKPIVEASIPIEEVSMPIEEVCMAVVEVGTPIEEVGTPIEGVSVLALAEMDRPYKALNEIMASPLVLRFLEHP